MIDLQSILGYSQGSPYAHNPYLDINTPEGLIDMSNTPIDLLGIDNKGNKKVMKGGRKNPYKFEGDMVREVPLGNVYAKGGMSREDLLSFLFEEDAKPEEKKQIPTAPSAEQVNPNYEQEEQDALAMEQANNFYNPADAGVGNPYTGTSNSLSSYGESYKDIDSKVAMATQELLEKFPNLKLTSGRRSWGDKDAHPKGRAVDLSYDDNAFKYYESVLVPKYGFNKALDPNHGTGKHIHLGYY